MKNNREKSGMEILVNTLVDYNINPKEYAKSIAADSFICGIASYNSEKGHFVFDDTFSLDK